MNTVIFVLLNVFALSTAVEVSPFILGGTDTEIGEFPFIVSLQFIFNGFWSHYCAGTIINDFWILTTAACVYLDDPTQNRAQYGVNEISNEPYASNVVAFDRLLWHEDFNISTLFNNIGLVKTQFEMKNELFEYKVKLPISSAHFVTGLDAVIIGMSYKIIKQIHHHDNPIKVSVELVRSCQ